MNKNKVKQKFANIPRVYLISSTLLTAFSVFPFDGNMDYQGINYQFGIVTKFFMLIFGIIGGVIGMFIGKTIRDFTIPDSFFTTGGLTSIARTKIFWSIGPQSIGCFAGVLAGLCLPLAISMYLLS